MAKFMSNGETLSIGMLRAIHSDHGVATGRVAI
jgi:hypothetical protein